MPERFDPYQEWLGIFPHEHPIDHYRLLGLNRFESDSRVIEQAADHRMAVLRSYQTGARSQFSQQLLNEVSQARIALLDPGAKAAYDEMLQAMLATDEMPPMGISTFDSAPAHQTQSATGPVANATTAAVPSEQAPPQQVPPPQAHSQRGPTLSVQSQPRVRAASQSSTATSIVVAVVCAVFIAGLGFFLLRQFGIAGNNPPPSQPVSPTPDLTDTPQAVAEEPGLVRQQPDGRVEFELPLAELRGAGLQRTADGIEGWKVNDSVEWTFRADRLPRGGVFRVQVFYSDSSQGCEYSIGVDERRKTLSTRATTSPVTDEDFLFVPKAGTHKLTLRALSIQGKQFMKLRGVALEIPERSR